MGGKRLTPGERKKIYSLHDEGMTNLAIADIMKRSPAFICGVLKKRVEFAREDTKPVMISADGSILENFTPLYKRIKYLNEQKIAIDEELRNIKATLKNALDIIESGDTAKPVKPEWGAKPNENR